MLCRGGRECASRLWDGPSSAGGHLQAEGWVSVPKAAELVWSQKQTQNEWELEDGDVVITLSPADSEFWALPFYLVYFFD